MASTVSVNVNANKNGPDQKLQVDRYLLYEHEFPGQAFVSAHLQRLQHGVFTQDSKEVMHVTFAAITFTMHPAISISHRFVSASITVTARSKDEPIRFLKFSPHLAYGRIGSRNFQLDTTVGVPQAPVNLSPTPSMDCVKDRVVETTAKVQGSTRSTTHYDSPTPHSLDKVTNPHVPHRRPDTKLVWTLEESNEQKTGLPLEFTCVFLMERPFPPYNPSRTRKTSLPPITPTPPRKLFIEKPIPQSNEFRPSKPTFPTNSQTMRPAQTPEVEKSVADDIGVGPTKPMFPLASPTKKVVVNLSKPTTFIETHNKKVLPNHSSPTLDYNIPTLNLNDYSPDRAPPAPVSLNDKNITPRARGEAKPKEGFFHKGIFLHSSQVSLQCLEDRTEHEPAKTSVIPLEDCSEAKPPPVSPKFFEHCIEPQAAQALNRLSPQFLPLYEGNFVPKPEVRKAFLHHFEDIPEKQDLYNVAMKSDTDLDAQEDTKKIRRSEPGFYKTENTVAMEYHLEALKFHIANIKNDNDSAINMQEDIKPIKSRLNIDTAAATTEHAKDGKLHDTGVKSDPDSAISMGIQENIDIALHNTRIKLVTAPIVEHTEEFQLHETELRNEIKAAAQQTVAGLKLHLNHTPHPPPRHKNKPHSPNTNPDYDMTFTPLTFSIWVEPQISEKKRSEVVFPGPEEVTSTVSGQLGQRFPTGQVANDGEEFVNGLYNFATLSGIFD